MELRVWLISVGEPVPTDGPHMRLLRAGTLAETLADLGAQVVWWTSAFDHLNKRHRVAGHATVPLRANLALKLLKGCGYAKNVSLARLRDGRQVARAFGELAGGEPEPDVIVSCLPVPGICQAAIRYAAPRGIPVVVDLRDKWPDVFLDLAPGGLRKAAKLALRPLYRQTAEVCRRAAGLVGVTEEYLHWGLGYAGRRRGPCDAVIPFAFRRRTYPESLLAEARAFWCRHRIGRNDGWFTACFLGTVGRQFALEAVIDAARILQDRGERVRLVICGKGESLQQYRRLTAELPNVIFPGWVDAVKMQALMELAEVGLAPYRNTANFNGHIPNKPGEYLSAGLPVVSTLPGRFAGLLEQFGCGLTYSAEDAPQLAEILTRLARHPELLSSMSRGARRLFEWHFDAERVYRAYADQLCRIAELFGRGSLCQGAGVVLCSEG